MIVKKLKGISDDRWTHISADGGKASRFGVVDPLLRLEQWAVKNTPHFAHKLGNAWNED